MAALSDVNVKFGVNIADFRSSLQTVEKALEKTGKKMQSIGKAMSTYISLPLAALGAASVKSAIDAEETFSKFDTVFRDVAKSAEDAHKILRNEYGLSIVASKQMLADTGNLLIGFGFTQKGALDLSLEIQKLSVDLASFTNYEGGATGASEALTKALLGEREMLKNLGIAISEEDVKKQLAIQSSEGLRFATEKEAKAHATYALIVQQSGNAIGDYERTKHSAANQTRLFQTSLENLRVTFGAYILPLFTKVVTLANDLVNWFVNLSDTTKGLIVVIGGLVAATGPLLVGLGFLATSIIPMIKTGITLITPIFSVLTLKIIAATAAVAGLILITKGVIDSWDTVKAYFGQLWERIKLMFIEGVAATLKAFNKFTSIIGLDFSDTIQKMEKSAEGIKSALDAEPVVTFGDMMSDIGNNIVKTFSNIKEAVTGTKDEIVDTNKELENTGGGGAGGAGINRTMDSGISAPNKGVLDNIIKLPDTIRGIAQELPQATALITDEMRAFSDDVNSIIGGSISGAFASLASSIGEAMASGANVLASVGKSILSSLAGFLGQLGKMMIEYGTMAIVKAKLDASLAIPGAGFVTGPLAIAAGAALLAISAAIGSFGSGKSSGGSGGGDLGPAEGVPARAMGGSVQSGVPYLVGERGPELFTPSGYGSITNARNTAMAGGEMVIRVVGELIGQGTILKAVIDDTVRISGRTS